MIYENFTSATEPAHRDEQLAEITVAIKSGMNSPQSAIRQSHGHIMCALMSVPPLFRPVSCRVYHVAGTDVMTVAAEPAGNPDTGRYWLPKLTSAIKAACGEESMELSFVSYRYGDRSTTLYAPEKGSPARLAAQDGTAADIIWRNALGYKGYTVPVTAETAQLAADILTDAVTYRNAEAKVIGMIPGQGNGYGRKVIIVSDMNGNNKTVVIADTKMKGSPPPRGPYYLIAANYREPYGAGTTVISLVILTSMSVMGGSLDFDAETVSALELCDDPAKTAEELSSFTRRPLRESCDLLLKIFDIMPEVKASAEYATRKLRRFKSELRKMKDK